MTKLIFFGNERLATNAPTSAPTLRKLIESGYEIEAVIVSHADTQSRQKRDLEISHVASSYDVPVIVTDRKTPLMDIVRSYNAEAAVLIAFGQIIPQAVIDLFPKGIINVHPSLLPSLRGPTPIETAILEQLKETGVSIMQLAAKMDAGPVYVQEKYPLTGKETKFGLAEELNALGAKLLTQHLDAILDGTLVPQPQDEQRVTFSRLIKKEDGTIDWNKPADSIEREIRAYAHWPQSRTRLGAVDVIITRAHTQPGALSPGQISVVDGVIAMGTGKDTLCIDMIKPLGKRNAYIGISRWLSL